MKKLLKDDVFAIFAILSTVTVIAIIWFISIFVNLYTNTETAVANDKVIFPTVIDNDFKPLIVNENSKTRNTERKVAVKNEKQSKVKDEFVKVGKTKINITKLIELTKEEKVSPDWDDKYGKYDTCYIVAKYLNECAGFSKELSAGIAGNVALEGDFGYVQGTYTNTKSYQEAMNKLSNGLGYGICQWTYHTLKRELKKYYAESANKLQGYKFEFISKVAELAYLIDTVNEKDYSKEVKNHTGSLEQKVYSSAGLFAVDYERYAGSARQWTRTSTGVYLQSAKSNGGMRATYALNIYNEIFK
jgi:hypothetical protein